MNTQTRHHIDSSTIIINGRKIQAPHRVELEQGQRYFAALPSGWDWHIAGTWGAGLSDQFWLDRGLLHLTKEAAIAHAKALVSFTSKEGA